MVSLAKEGRVSVGEVRKYCIVSLITIRKIEERNDGAERK